MQRMGLTAPFYGPLYRRNILSPASSHGEHVLGKDLYSSVTLRGVEVEFAAVMKKALSFHGGRTEPFTLDEVLRAVDYFVPAVEVCATRLKKPPTSAFVSIADQASHGLLLLAGEKISVPSLAMSSPAAVQEWADEQLNSYQVSLFEGVFGGKELAKGSGRDVLTTGPVTSLAWLANALASKSIGSQRTPIPLHLKPGDVITTGTMTGLTPITLGGNRPHPFGVAEASFEARFVNPATNKTIKLSVAFLR
jgi:2-keto-4-pentenoate hydratase